MPIAGELAFHSLEMEAESELQEIQSMLSMFDVIDAPALDKPMATTGSLPCSQYESRSEQHLSTSDRPSSSKHCKEVEADDNMDIESVLQEMTTIEGIGYMYIVYSYMKTKTIHLHSTNCSYRLVCSGHTWACHLHGTNTRTSLYMQTSFKTYLKHRWSPLPLVSDIKYSTVQVESVFQLQQLMCI